MAAMERIWGSPNFAVSLFGVASGLAFFLPGLKYYRLQRSK
jgi:hypothetical protein